MIHPNQVLSKFNEGMDTSEIAKFYLITEAEAYALLDQARRVKFTVNKNSESVMRGAYRGARAAAVSKRNKPVTLASVKILEVR